MSIENEENDILLTKKSLFKSIIGSNKNRINLKCDKPGNTLLISKLKKNITEIELLTLFRTYGSVSQLFISKGLALLEFVNSAITRDLVVNSKINPLRINNHVVNLSFSCQSIDEYKSLLIPNVKRANLTKVLHFLITNALYSINVDILSKICSPHGKIVRIYIGKKNTKDNSIEALIEFAKASDAISVKDSLNGNDIYSSCCSLTINYSMIHRIFVQKNGSESYDYSIVPKLGLLGPPPSLPDTDVYTSTNDPIIPPFLPIPDDIQPLYQASLAVTQPFTIHQSTPEKKPSNSSQIFYKSDATIQESIDGVVLQCRHFSSKLKADNFFNLFCLYGNVVKVKLAKENAKVALIQMSNREGADFCLEMLNGVSMFNKTLEITSTKLTQLMDSIPNSDPVTSYYNDVNNRFKSSYQGKSRIFCPSQTLHFFNVPSNFRAEEIVDVFVSAKVSDPCQVVMFPQRKTCAPNQRVSLVTGLIEFDSVDQALEAVAMVNHTGLVLPQIGHPFHIKLAFSQGKISEQHIKSTSDTAQFDHQRRPSKRTNEGSVPNSRYGDSKISRVT